MYKWKQTNEIVKAKTSHNFESLTLTLHDFDLVTKRIVLIDKQGSLYHTNYKHVEWVLPNMIGPLYTIRHEFLKE